MHLDLSDIVVFLLFFAVVVAFSLWRSRKKSGEHESEDYFLAGRGLPWWLIGISIVAANISTEQFVGMAGQGAGSIGLTVSAWQLTGTMGIVIVAFTLLPLFLRSGISTMPEFLEIRYNSAARAVMAFLTVVVYVTVLIVTVLYSGSITLSRIFPISVNASVWIIAAIAAVYTTIGGLRSVAWADLFMGFALLVGGLATMFLGMHAVEGWQSFTVANAGKLHMIRGSESDLPWYAIVGGMWIPIVYYVGLNQFIVQRTLAARSIRQGQLGVIFAGALWLLVPFAIVIPGIIASQLYGSEFQNADLAYPTLIARLIPAGMAGFMFAAIAGAVISSLASMLNSASTIFTLDIYQHLSSVKRTEHHLVFVGRTATIVSVVIGGVLTMVLLNDPNFESIFDYVQKYQGYISPGIVAAFLFGLIVRRAPRSAGVVALISTPFIYGGMEATLGASCGVHYLVNMLITVIVVFMIMGVMTFVSPLKEPWSLPVRRELEVQTSWWVWFLGGLNIFAVIAFFVVFW